MASQFNGKQVKDSTISQSKLNLTTPVAGNDAATKFYVDSGITSLSTAINNISTTSLSTALSSEIVTRGSADTSLSTALSAEVSGRTTADANFSTILTNEISSRLSSDASLSTAITGVTSSTTSLSTALSTAISNEIITRGSADTSLSTAISTSTSTLSSAALQPWVDINRNGFVDNSETSISFNPSTYVFTLSGLTSSWSYYRGGIKYTVSGNKTITLAGSPPATGTYYITINSTDGTLQSGLTAWTLADTTLPVVTIRWNNSNTPKYHMAEERHTIAMDRMVHKYLHQTRGTQFVSGGDLTGPSLTSPVDADVTFGVSETVIADEDLYQTLSGLTRPNGSTPTYNIYYRYNSTGWTWQPSEVPFKYTGTGYIEYDSGGTMTSGITSRYYNTYLLFTDQNLTARYSIIVGRNSFASISEAQAENPLYFDFTGFPVAESIIAYQFTWGTSNSYGNKGKCRLERTPVKINVAATTTVGSGAGTDHNTLAGLQGGLTGQMYHLTLADYTTVTGISSALSTEISARTSFDTSLSTAISSEVSTRGSADTSLSTAISTEISTRGSADTSLSTAVESKLSLAGGTLTGGLTGTTIYAPQPHSFVHNGNEITLANNYAGGILWINYRGAGSKLTYYMGSGLANDTLGNLYIDGLSGSTLYMTGDGYFGGTVTSNSDIRNKDVFGVIEPVLSKYDQINPIVFKFKNDTDNKVQYGYSAQELYSVFPNTVHYDKNSDTYGVNSLALNAMNTKAIKELKEEVEMLKEILRKNNLL